MADLSLDEFIRKKNVKVRVGKTQQAQGKGKPFQKPLITKKKGGLQQSPKVFDARQRLGTKPVGDARQRLGTKLAGDARNKIIIQKKNGAGDARNKIVQKQVQKGTFDARSVLQRQGRNQTRKGQGGLPNFTVKGGAGVTVPLKRTLSNPNAQGKGQIKVTDSGLVITRPTPNTQASLYGSSLQITKKNKPFEGSLATSVPIIQIRNDRYRQPVQSSLPQTGQSAEYYPQPTSRQSLYPDYDSSSYSYSNVSYTSSHRGYRDLDDPEFNPASIATPEIPKIQISNVRPAERPSIRPISFSGDYPQTRVPPGAATVSQGTKQTVPKAVLQPAKLTQTGLKRRPAPVTEVSGPLRLGKGGGPGIDLGPNDPSPSKRSRLAPAVDDGDNIDMDSGMDVISPLQGFRVMVTNLFTGVTQDDIIELFGAVGPLKKAKLLKPGTAEVVYVSKNDAQSAVQKYHSRELDGQPMYVKMTTPVAAVVKKAVGDSDPDITGEALRLYKKGTGIGSLPEAQIEIPTIHRALFKAGPPAPNKSVKFTVKI